MDIISAVKAAIDSGSMTIRRRDEDIIRIGNPGIFYTGHPLVVTRMELDPNGLFGWNPTLEEILADDWVVVGEDAKIPND